MSNDLLLPLCSLVYNGGSGIDTKISRSGVSQISITDNLDNPNTASLTTGSITGSVQVSTPSLILNGTTYTNNLVVGPGTSTDNAIARFDLATGKLLQNSGAIIDDSNNLTGINQATMNTLSTATITAPVDLSINPTSNITFNGKNLNSCGIITSNSSFRGVESLSTDISFIAYVTGDPFFRYRVDASGRTFWGSGSASSNADLGRAGTIGLYIGNGSGGAGVLSLSSGLIYGLQDLAIYPSSYNTGSISQALTTVTGVGTAFTNSMLGGTILWNSGERALITAVNSGTSLTVDRSQTVASGGYSISYGGCNFSYLASRMPVTTFVSSGTNTSISVNAGNTSSSLVIRADGRISWSKDSGVTAPVAAIQADTVQGLRITDTSGGAGIISTVSGTIYNTRDLSVASTTYAVGTASQATTTVTGVGTTFTTAMIGGLIIWNTGERAYITAFVSTTSLTVDRSQTVASGSYTIYYDGCTLSNANGYIENFLSNSIKGIATVSSTGVIFSRLYSSTFDNFAISADGSHLWGTGSATQDIRFGRSSSPTRLFLDDTASGSSLLQLVGGGAIYGLRDLATSTTTYAVGTASQATTTVTGSGTTFTSAMVGGFILWNSGSKALITAFGSTTSLTVDRSQSVSSGSYTIYYGGTNVSTSGLALPTSGGNPSILNYYEEFTHTTTWSGPWAAAQSGNIRFTRVGRMVVGQITLRTATATVATSISLDTVIPSRFRPQSFYANCGIIVTNNGTSQAGGITVNSSTGAAAIYSTPAFAAFTGAGTCGLANDFCLVYAAA